MDKVWSAFKSLMGRLGSFLLWLVSGFGFFNAFGKKKYSIDEVVVYKVHDAFYLWGFTLIGFISAFVAGNYPSTADTMAWLWLITGFYTAAAILFDISVIRMTLVAVVVGFILLGGKYVGDWLGVGILSGLFGSFVNLDPKLDPGTVYVVSWVSLIVWLGAMFHSFSYGRVTISANGIEEWHLAIGSEITDRFGLKFRTRYDDLLECILGIGCGNLQAMRNDQTVVKQFDNILMLYFWWDRLDELLHQRSAVVDNAPDDTVAVSVRNNEDQPE